MGKRKENKDKLAVYLFKHIDPFFEIPIFIGNEMTDYTITITGDVISYTGYSGDKPVVLKPIKMSNGYYKVNITTADKKQHLVSVHRLVATAFIPNPDGKPEVNHKDGNKSHNWVWNLEWATSKENVDHAFSTGLHQGMKGETHPMSKITEPVVIRIAELLVSGKYTYQEIADLTGATYSIVKKIKNKTRWTHLTENYDFSNYRKKLR